MQTVVELPSFQKSAQAAGMTAGEVEALVTALARNPLAGISLGSGLRKVRAARTGAGKSGGYRTIHFFGGDDMPIFLIVCFAKNQKDNITEAERKSLANLCSQLKAEYQRPQ